MRTHLKSLGEVKADFRTVIEVDPVELASLSEKARMLGCAPSKNLYDKEATITVNPETYMKRSAGGHIHIGLSSMLLPHAERLVPILDIVLGNTCVMIDRDPGTAERRSVYGRAGEYRLPKHGLEYRTLSNFWLRACPLTSFVLGMTRVCSNILYTTLVHSPTFDAETTLLKRVDLDQVREAINTNDLALAKKNWESIRPFLCLYNLSGTGVGAHNASLFDYFVQRIEQKGIDYWFPEDPLEHWCAILDAHHNSKGFESFLDGPVANDLHTIQTRENQK